MRRRSKQKPWRENKPRFIINLNKKIKISAENLNGFKRAVREELSKVRQAMKYDKKLGLRYKYLLLKNETVSRIKDAIKAMNEFAKGKIEKAKIGAVAMLVGAIIGLNGFSCARIVYPEKFEQVKVWHILTEGPRAGHSDYIYLPRYIFRDIVEKYHDYPYYRVDSITIEGGEQFRHAWVFGEKALYVFGPDFNLNITEPKVIPYEKIRNIEFAGSSTFEKRDFSKITIEYPRFVLRYEEDGQIKRIDYIVAPTKCVPCDVLTFINALITFSHNNYSLLNSAINAGEAFMKYFEKRIKGE